MKLNKTLAALAIPLMALSLSATAELMHTDWKVTGDERVTLDTITGLEWLKLDETNDKSIDTIVSLQDSVYEGWRFATDTEVHALIVNMFPNLPYETGAEVYITGASVESSQDWFTWMAQTQSTTSRNGVSHYSYGFVNDDSITMYGARYASINTYGVYDNYTDQAYTSSYSNALFGVFLVSDGGTTLSSINDPSINTASGVASPNDVPVAMVGLLSCFGLFAGRRKKAE